MKYERILAVGGHIGDAELTCGGVLATCAAAGGHIATLALTAGERGNPPGMSAAEYRVQKLREAEEFAAMLSGRSYVLDYPDGELPFDKEAALKITDIIRAEKPDLILTHHETSMHRDHACCNRLVREAWFLASLRGLEREDPACFAPLRFAENWEDAAGFRPYEYIEVSEEGFALWQRAVVTHWFVTGSTSFPYFEYYSHLKRLRGIEARKAYAEAYMRLPEERRVITSL